MYKKEFPVPGQALGYYVNCLESSTKYNLYIINRYLHRFSQNGTLPNGMVIDQNETIALRAGLDNLISCDAVYKVVPELESEFCKKGIDWMYTSVQLFIWLMVAMIFLGVAIGRIEILIWRRKKEIESMMETMEVIFIFLILFLGCLLRFYPSYTNYSFII